MLLTSLQYCSPKRAFQGEESSPHYPGWGVEARENLLLRRNESKCSNMRNSHALQERQGEQKVLKRGW